MSRIRVLLICAPGETAETIAASMAHCQDIELKDTAPGVAEAYGSGRYDVILVEGGPDADAIARFVSSAPLDSGVILFSVENRKSMVAESIIRGLEAGALDYAVLPTGRDNSLQPEVWGRRLATKIRTISTRIYSRAALLMAGTQGGEAPLSDEQRLSRLAEASKNLSQDQGNFSLIAIGASTGGPEALLKMLPLLPKGLPVPILIVLHMPRDFTQSMAANLDRKCRFNVTEARDKEILKPGCAYLAPGDMHLSVVRGIGTNLLSRLDDNPPVNECRPSVDVLFSSAARACPGKAIGVILTGMGCDGAAGAGLIKQSGGLVIAQDRASSLIWGMPGSAHDAGHTNITSPLLEIPLRLVEFLSGKTEGPSKTSRNDRYANPVK